MQDLTIVFENNNHAVTSSRLVAEYFHKRHDHIVRDIDNLKEKVSPQFWGANFLKTQYQSRGKEYTEYLMTKDGFTILAMGFTGAKAMQFKEAYINAFNKMESLLKGNSTILQLEKRIQELEQANKPITEISEESILLEYFSSLKQALRSGKYYLKRKCRGRITTERHTGNLLGTYDMFTYSIIGQKSYDIYKEYAKNPVHRQALYNLLLTRGYLIPPEESERKKTKSISVKKQYIDKHEYRCLIIKRDKTKINLLN